MLLPLLEPEPVPGEVVVSGVEVEDPLDPVDGDDPVDGVVSCIRVPVEPELMTSMRLTCSVSPEPEKLART